MSTERRWGSGEVDPREHNLPALKVRYVLDALASVPPGAALLDFGCGEGKLLRTLAKLRPELEFAGADVQAPLTPGPFSFHALSDRGRLPFPDGQFAVVTAIDVLEHVPSLEATLREIARVLAPGGLFIAFVPAEGEPLVAHSLYRRLLGDDLYARTKDHTQAYTRREIVARMESLFALESVRYSYHLIGATMDASFFALCAIPAVGEWWWRSSTVYHPEHRPGLADRAMRAVNAVCYYESRALAAWPSGSIGVHVVGRKR
jgi:ubiquinone/menaquinone biosynthesis C-methylase UbiE